MVQRIQILLEDDLDGSDASETVSFAMDGVTYEIDLNDSNAAKLRADLGPFILKARRSGRARTAVTSGRAGGKTDRAQLTAMREWARKKGYKVSDRGRVSQEIQDAYNAQR